MARIKVRYLQARKLAAGGVHYHWVPKTEFRHAGWKTRGPFKTLEDAILACEAANAELDAWRKAGRKAGRPGETVIPNLAAATLPVSAASGAPDRQPYRRVGTLAQVFADWEASSYYQSLADETQKFYRKHAKTLRAWAGDTLATDLTPRVIRQGLYDPFAKVSEWKATGLVRTLSAALGLRHLLYDADHPAYAPPAENPCRELRMEGTPKGTGRLWTPDALAFHVEAADRMGLYSIGTGMTLNYWLGQRVGDLIKVPPDPLDRDGWFRLRQNKTGTWVTIDASIVPQVVQRIQEERRRQRERGVIGATLILCERDNKPYKRDRFIRTVAEVRAKVAEEWPAFDPDPKDLLAEQIPTKTLHFRFLRHTAVTRLIEAGVEVPMIANITGHSPATIYQILQSYQIHTAETTRQALARRVAFEQEENETTGKS